MALEGVDFAFGRPGGAALAAAGKYFACRYVPYPGDGGKGISTPEIGDLTGHGLAVVLVFESVGRRALSAATAGVADGKQVKASLAALGLDPAQPVYFAVDFQMEGPQEPAVLAYFQGIATVLEVGQIGVYGGLGTVQFLHAQGAASWFWQTYAWSGGILWPLAHIYQYLNSQTINHAAVDFDRAFPANYGQIPQEPDLTFENTLTPFVANFTPGGTLYKDAARTQTDTTGWPGGTTIGVAGVGTTQGAFPDVAVCVNLPAGTTRKLVYIGANHIVPGTLAVRPGTVFPAGLTQADVDAAVAAQKATDAAAAAASVTAATAPLTARISAAKAALG